MSSTLQAADNSATAAAKRTPVIEDATVRELLAQHAYLEPIVTGDGEHARVRVRCELTQHEMLPRKDAIETHLRSKKFVKAKEWYCYDYSKYAPFIVPHRRKPKSLFCNVTHMVLNRIPAEVERHVNGKKFQRLKENFKLGERKSKKSKRSDDEDDGDEEMKNGDGDDGDDNDDDDGGFDANAFEFENAEVLLSDDDDEDEQVGGAKLIKKNASLDDDDDDDDEVDDDDDDEGADSDMAEFYPNDDDDDDGRLDHETVVKLAAAPLNNSKKRKAADADSAKQETSSSSSDAATKKRKLTKAATKAKAAPTEQQQQQQQRVPKQASKARLSAKDRRQLKKPSFKK